MPAFDVRLPVGDSQASALHLVVHIRDRLNCITERNLSQVTVVADSEALNNLINDIQTSGSSTNNPILHLLASGDENTVSQVLTSVSQQLNSMNDEMVADAVSR